MRVKRESVWEGAVLREMIDFVTTQNIAQKAQNIKNRARLQKHTASLLLRSALGPVSVHSARGAGGGRGGFRWGGHASF